jgi:hypothetical protein
MISHVGPRGLVPYVVNIRGRIRHGGYERMMANANEMKERMGESGFRAWQVYLSGGSQTLLNGSAHVYRVYCQAK